MIAGIEVKARATVKASDFGGLRALAEVCGDPSPSASSSTTARTSYFWRQAGGGAIVEPLGRQGAAG
jgi:hypothetical protein